MTFKALMGGALAFAMIATPALAAAANPASSLSVSSGVRAGAPTAKKSKLAGGGLIAAVIAAGVVAIGVVAAVNDDDNSDSN